MASRKSKVIKNQADIEYIANVDESMITLSFFMETFGTFEGKARFNPYDIIEIPAGKYGPKGHKNKKSFTTTVGIYIWNKYFIEKDLFHLYKYINKTIDSKEFKKLNSQLSYALAEDDITIEVFKRYLMKTQHIMPVVSIISPNHTEKMLTCTKVINKKKDELIEKYKDDIEAGNEVVATKMEKELLDFAIEYMEDDPSMDVFLSGARGSIGNNFKNMFVMKGAIKDPDPNAKQKYKIATSNYIDGIKPEEYSLFANSLAAGPYKRAVKTAYGGYLEKLFLYAFQHVRLDEEGSDCGTKRTIKVTLTKNNISQWMYSYIVEGTKLIELTSKNMNKYIGKTVKFRFSALCESKTGICNKCMGNLEYRRGTRNSGIESTVIASKLKNISMKAFHDSVEKMTSMDINKAFGV